MAKQANRMMIGGFVVIALFILAASLVVFGSGKLFQKTQRFVMFFEGSVRGLSVGSPVLWEGVQVGSVTSIEIIADLKEGKAQIPIVVEILPDRFGAFQGERNPRKNLPRLIERGLRAVMVTQSFITGQLAIEVRFFPGTPAIMRKSPATEYIDYMEIPTIPSTTQRLFQTLENLDLEKIEKKFTASLEGIDRLVNNPDLAPSIHNLREALQNVNKLVTRIDRQVDPLANDVKRTSQNFSRLAKDLDSRIKVLAGSLEKTLSNLDSTLTGFDKTMTSVRGVVSPDAPAVGNLENALKEVSAMSRSLRELSDLLEQQPESLLRGKKKTGGR